MKQRQVPQQQDRQRLQGVDLVGGLRTDSRALLMTPRQGKRCNDGGHRAKVSRFPQLRLSCFVIPCGLARKLNPKLRGKFIYVLEEQTTKHIDETEIRSARYAPVGCEGLILATMSTTPALTFVPYRHRWHNTNRSQGLPISMSRGVSKTHTMYTRLDQQRTMIEPPRKIPSLSAHKNVATNASCTCKRGSLPSVKHAEVWKNKKSRSYFSPGSPSIPNMRHSTGAGSTMQIWV
ncbi:unnamed protein product [Ectocarpus sp. 12 AP-2014]